MTWRSDFNIVYGDNETESQAFKTFCINLKRIESHNQKYFACNSSYALGLWKKSDMNDKVVNKELNGLEAALEIGGRLLFISGIKILEANVSYLNYVDEGYVTGVQDQGESTTSFVTLFQRQMVAGDSIRSVICICCQIILGFPLVPKKIFDLHLKKVT